MKGQTSIGSHRHIVSLQNPTSTADGDGGFTQMWTDLSPAMWRCSILPATASALEHIKAATVISEATHIVTGRYHAGITTKTRITFGTRTFNVTGVSNPEERNIETIVTAVEVVA